ncbi:Putative major facilitator, sugar transporter, major facilitator superfamily [Colletotrichum destructivum]|uniref:Major facilitator, sugar transporter, major facilitator superfamily n=1 Tax=Colletotrichum destructivum TaxID=34406 RepID=A0AAX4ICZ8_9PEZI|nr:Putative major facilitator, sugar transporter, major facilitator superfamily [Colletotrichum destructivum]
MPIVGAKEQHVDPTLSRIAQDDKKIWYQKPNLRFLYLILVPTGLGVEWTSGFDSSMMNSLQAVTSWFEYFGRPNASRLGLLNAMYSLGALMAIPFVPFVSQRFGRRRTILFGSYIMVLGAGLQAGARNVDMFLASRWILGFGIPFAIINASSLIGELSYAKERPIMTSLFNASWFVGAILAAGITYGTFQMSSTWAWRIPSLLQLVPSGCQIAFMPFCPESPRWLISKDRGDEAYAILHKYHSEGENGEEFVRLEYAQIMSTIQQEKEVASKFAWADVFRDAAMRRRFMLAAIMGFFTQWSGNGLLSFYMKKILNLVGITDNRTVQKVILSNTCWGFINAVPIALIAPRFPRRKMFLLCTIGTAAVYTVWTIASARFAIENSQRAAIPVLVFIFVYSPFYNIGWNALAYTYLVELFPFSQRAKGIAVEQLTVRFAVFFNTYVNPIALDSIGWKYYIVYCVWILVEIATVYMIFPETQGRTLEELSFMFEGKEVQDKVQKNTQKVLQVELEDIGRQESRPGSRDAGPDSKV